MKSFLLSMTLLVVGGALDGLEPRPAEQALLKRAAVIKPAPEGILPTGSMASSFSSPGRPFRAVSAPAAVSFGMMSRSKRALRSAIFLRR